MCICPIIGSKRKEDGIISQAIGADASILSTIATGESRGCVHTSLICLTVVSIDREYTRYSDYRKDIDDDKHTDKYLGMTPTATTPIPNAASCFNLFDDMDKTVLFRS